MASPVRTPGAARVNWPIAAAPSIAAVSFEVVPIPDRLYIAALGVIGLIGCFVVIHLARRMTPEQPATIVLLVINALIAGAYGGLALFMVMVRATGSWPIMPG